PSARRQPERSALVHLQSDRPIAHGVGEVPPNHLRDRYDKEAQDDKGDAKDGPGQSLGVAFDYSSSGRRSLRFRFTTSTAIAGGSSCVVMDLSFASFLGFFCMRAGRSLFPIFVLLYHTTHRRSVGSLILD